MAIEWSREGFEVSDDPCRLDLATIHRFIATESYWAEGISESLLARAIAHSLCFGLYRDSRQLGFARVVTDRAMPEATRYLEIHRPDVYKRTEEAPA